jgi:benzoyl-CoA reductase/2-hydroxyglutaryl-CoA dehydratase subunit BcrC/BadD/HgdB
MDMHNTVTRGENTDSNADGQDLRGSPVSAFDELARTYRERDRDALAWKERGGNVIGCLGSDVPEEFLIAAGYLPVRICGDPSTSAAVADSYLEGGFDPLVRAQFARIVDGSYSYLDHLIVSNSSDALIRVFYYLRALHQVEPNLPIPDLYFFDFLHTRFRTSALYDRDRVRDLQHVIESWRGQPIAPEDLAQAITTCNENRQLLRQLKVLRGPQAVRVSGAQALQIIGASLFLPRTEHSHLLQRFLAEAQDLPPLPGVRLFVTGSAQDHTDFYELVESCGAVIVGEDHDLGSRLFSGEIDTTVDPIDAIVDRYHLRAPSTSQASVSERVTALVEHVRTSGAQGVIFFIHAADDAPSWDFPEQRKALEALEVSVLLLDRQPYKLTDPEGLRSKIATFVESIRGSDRIWFAI